MRSLAGLVTVEVVLARLDIVYPTLKRWIASGRFPKPIRNGRKMFWFPTDIESYFDKIVAERDQSPEPSQSTSVN